MRGEGGGSNLSVKDRATASLLFSVIVQEAGPETAQFDDHPPKSEGTGEMVIVTVVPSGK
jgi:hypothetical protein